MNTTALDRLLAQPLDYRSQRVISLPMMDEAHERPAGTAYRNFREHRMRMVEGRHFFTSTRQELATNFVGNPDIEQILLTERGYLLLVKSFRDDLAWEVQERLVDGYFRGRAIIPAPSNDVLLHVVAEQYTALAKTLTTALAPLADRLARVEQSVQAHGTEPITAKERARLKRAITALARARTASNPKAYRAERQKADTALRERLRFPAFGGLKWERFPRSRAFELLPEIEGMERDAERLLASDPRQMPLQLVAK